MDLITFSNFDKIANTFTVSDIADSKNLFFYDADDVVDEFNFISKGKGTFGIINYGVFLIQENENVIGIYSHKSSDIDLLIDDDGGVLNSWRDIMETISPNLYLSGNTPLIDVLTLFREKDDFFLVLNKNEITHSFCYYDLDCNEVKISIFALILELENILNDLIIKLKLSVEDFLSQERIDIINNQNVNNKFKKFKDMVYYTNIRDKFKVLSEIFSNAFIDRKELKSFANKLSEVRNKIAHGESIIGYDFLEVIPREEKPEGSKGLPLVRNIEEKVLFEPKDMKLFIQQLRNMINFAKNKLID